MSAAASKPKSGVSWTRYVARGREPVERSMATTVPGAVRYPCAVGHDRGMPSDPVRLDPGERGRRPRATAFWRPAEALASVARDAVRRLRDTEGRRRRAAIRAILAAEAIPVPLDPADLRRALDEAHDRVPR